MKTTQLALAIAAVAVTLAASGAEATTRYRNVDSFITTLQGGGQLIVAADIKCTNGQGNFALETDGDTNVKFEGCAHLEGNRVVVNWNDGASYAYASGQFRRTLSWMNI